MKLYSKKCHKASPVRCNWSESKVWIRLYANYSAAGMNKNSFINSQQAHDICQVTFDPESYLVGSECLSWLHFKKSKLNTSQLPNFSCFLKNVSYHFVYNSFITCPCASAQAKTHVASKKKTKLIIVRTLSRKKVSLALWRARRAHCLKGSQQSLHCRHAALIAQSCTSIKHQSLHTYSTLKLKHTITLFLLRIQKTYQLEIPVDLDRWLVSVWYIWL